jgi:outer membrane protein assembly factor BamB
MRTGCWVSENGVVDKTMLPCHIRFLCGALGALLAGTAAFAAEPPSARPPLPSGASTDVGSGLIASAEGGWPQWRGPRRDGVSDEKGLLPQWPEGGPKLLWKVGGLGLGWSSPIVVGERLFVTGDVGEDLIVFALDRAGNPQWKVTNGKAWKGPYPGARACCAFSESRLYHLGAHGRLACFDSGSGKELWAVDVLERFGARNITWAISECLLVDGSRVIVTPGGESALMAALDKRSGQAVWTTLSPTKDVNSYSSPILFRFGGRRMIVNCSGSHGFAVDADSGKLLWTVPLRNQFLCNVATPVYGSGCVFFVTPYGEEGRLYRLRSNREGIDAELAWKSPLDTVTGGAVLVDGALFASGYRKSKWWLAVDWRTGETRHQLKDFTTGAAIYADGRLYCLDERGRVGLLKIGARGMETVGRFRLPAEVAGDAWAHPVLYDGRLYLRYHDTLWCYDVKQ